MNESRVMIEQGEQLLEGLFAQGSLKGVAAVICHPHPLYGGDMDNGVVSTLQKVLHRCGCSTLRFNFRGVGGSNGVYGNGEGEEADLKAAVSYLNDLGLQTLHLAGYSFGAWIALRACHSGLRPASSILISPPLDFLQFDELQLPSCPSLITIGDRDDFCKRGSLQSWVSTQTAAAELISIEILSDCDHFYWGKEARLTDMIAEFFKRRFMADFA